MVQDVGPLSLGPLPQLKDLPDDQPQAGHTNEGQASVLAAPWFQAWRQVYVELASAGPDEEPPWATVVNRHPHAERGSGVPPQLGLSPIIFGAGTFGTGQYIAENQLHSLEPVRAVRLALLYGINAFDASPYYKNSEAILGRALAALKPTFPRSTYYLSTKCGRYGPNCSDFDYSPERVRSSVEQSLVRLDAEGWLDNVFMHDAEFISTPVGPAHDGGQLSATIVGSDARAAQEAMVQTGIEPTFAAASKVHGPGDERLLEAIRELFRLKDEGKIKMVGISGYPLPVLVRLARMVATNAPFRPLDSILSYSHHTLHTDTLPEYIGLFRQNPWTLPGAPEDPEAAQKWIAPIVMNASPFSMGLLTEAGPPAWHPAKPALHEARTEALSRISSLPLPTSPAAGEPQKAVSLAETALHYGLRGSEVYASPHASEVIKWADGIPATKGRVPALRTLAGLASVDQVHSAVEAYRTLFAGRQTEFPEGVLPFPLIHNAASYVSRAQVLHQAEQATWEAVESCGVQNETWESPPADARDISIPM